MKTPNLCKWKKDEIDEMRAKLEKIVAKPAYLCSRCARVAAKKKHLCKPEKIG